MADHLTGSGTELNDQAGSGAELDDLARSGAGLEFDAEAQRTLAAATFDFVENFFAEMRKPEHRAYDYNTEESDQASDEGERQTEKKKGRQTDRKLTTLIATKVTRRAKREKERPSANNANTEATR